MNDNQDKDTNVGPWIVFIAAVFLLIGYTASR